MEDFGKELLNYKEEKIFSTGFFEADECVRDVAKGSVITIGGRPAMGKTSFAVSIFNNLIERNKRVMWCSLEYNKPRLTKRIIGIKAKLDASVWHGDISKYKDTIEQTINFFADKDFFIFDKVNMSVDDIEEKIKEKNPEVVFIDYIQLIEMKKAPNFTEAINYAVKELKRIAAEYGTIFVILTQLSRALECRTDKRPMLSDIRNSSLLEEISDVIMMIYREEYYNSDCDFEKNKAEIIILKNEFGPTLTVSLNFIKGIFSNPLKKYEF